MLVNSAGGIFTQVFSLQHLDAADLALQPPEHIDQTSSDTATAAWRHLLASMALRKAGLESEANDYMNHASSSGFKDDLFSAEVLGEAAWRCSKPSATRTRPRRSTPHQRSGATCVKRRSIVRGTPPPSRTWHSGS